ncbi:hypothetical protein NX722_10615 [Endozoicomonas gorgoniicola]|uniref:Uncharacterized protein n=1 Tax=Endozoicomonas gorgoniicola TaxID=1234144 RepID=A0ABT3MUM2_9GAMM|nr:hypothetical protein [Endozoicomonas gorgoniicola]MCW7553077.1 hypothetical protein [Endozoicomonas gorgoniicola]
MIYHSATNFASAPAAPPAFNVADEKDRAKLYIPQKAPGDEPKNISDFRISHNIAAEKQGPEAEVTLTLKNGIKVPDYSKDREFTGRLKSMEMDKALRIRDLIKQYPDEFPMPGMAITAAAIKENIQTIKGQEQLLDGELQCILNIERELDELSPNYPYNQSFVITYKYLMYISLLFFRKQLTASDTKLEYDISDIDGRFDLYDFFDDIGLKIISLYKQDCRLTDLESLPWSLLLKDPNLFHQELKKNYYSIIWDHVDLKLDNPEVNVFQLGEPLIPCSDCLDVEDLNRLWPLPLWLVATSFSETTSADGFDMYPAAFFEHDVFHFKEKLRVGTRDIDQHRTLLKWIRQLYNHKADIKSVNFLAIELVLFDAFHESVLFTNFTLDKGVEDFFDNIRKTVMEVGPDDLPEKYKAVTHHEVNEAARWLARLPLKNISDSEFLETINANEQNFEAIGRNLRGLRFNTVKPEPAYMKEIIEQVSSNKRLLATHGFNDQRIASALRLYRKEAERKDLETDSPNWEVWSGKALADFQREAQWIMNYLKNAHLQGAWRCRAACQGVREEHSGGSYRSGVANL